MSAANTESAVEVLGLRLIRSGTGATAAEALGLDLYSDYATRHVVHQVGAERPPVLPPGHYTYELVPFEIDAKYGSPDGDTWTLVSLTVRGRRLRKDGTVNPEAAVNEVTFAADGQPWAGRPSWVEQLLAELAQPPGRSRPEQARDVAAAARQAYGLVLGLGGYLADAEGVDPYDKTRLEELLREAERLSGSLARTAQVIDPGVELV